MSFDHIQNLELFRVKYVNLVTTSAPQVLFHVVQASDRMVRFVEIDQVVIAQIPRALLVSLEYGQRAVGQTDKYFGLIVHNGQYGVFKLNTSDVSAYVGD